VQWQVCGVVTEGALSAAKSNVTSDTEETPRQQLRDRRVFAAHRMRDHNRAKTRQSNLRTAPTQVSRRLTPASVAGSGYTCGLWSLFHYLTGECSHAKVSDVSTSLHSIHYNLHL
jgi:hypothetical protein